MKRIIIIGATSGIGKEMALRFAAQGHLVGITGRRNDLLQEIKSLYPNNFFTACFNVTGKANENYVLKLIAALGGLDLLIYNAGFGDPSIEFDPETETATAQTNVMGCVEIVGLAYAYFLKKEQGQIAIISSVAALRGNSWAPAYSASKAFSSIYAEGLNMKARKLKKDILVTDIRLGFIATKMAKGNARFWVASPQKAAAQIIKAIEQKKRVAYVTKRWRLIALLLKILPFSLYRRLA